MSRLSLLDGLSRHLPLDAPNAMNLRDTLGHMAICDLIACLCVLVLDLRNPSANLPGHRMSRNIVHLSIGRRVLLALVGKHRCMRRRRGSSSLRISTRLNSRLSTSPLWIWLGTFDSLRLLFLLPTCKATLGRRSALLTTLGVRSDVIPRTRPAQARA